MTERIRVSIADDHPLLLDGLVATLSSAPDVEVVAATTDASHAVREAREKRPDIALLDVTMPGGGLLAATEIAAVAPDTRVIMLTVSEDADDVLAAMRAGAKGYVLKGVSGRELLNIIRSVHGGSAYVPPTLAHGLLNQRARPETPDRLADLTERERDVLKLVGAGLSNAQIGGEIGVAEKTVKHYMTSILAKLEVGSRVEAALLAFKAGLVPEPPSER